MKLYDSRRAPNPRRVRWVMAEKGIVDIEVVQTDLMTGAHRTPEYLAEVGAPVCPALILDDGTAVTESVAICRYLEARYPEPNLFGRTPEEVAVIEMWTRRVEMGLATNLMMAVRHGHPALAAVEKNQTPELAAFSRTVAEGSMKGLDRRLADHPFIGGDRVTIADVLAICSLDFARMIRIDAPPELPHFARWARAMRERPAAQAGM